MGTLEPRSIRFAQIETMKLSLYFTALVNATPQKKKLNNSERGHQNWGNPVIPSRSCGDEHEGYSTYLTVVDNGQNGQFTIEEYPNEMNCFVDFASQCGETGVNVEVTHLSVEQWDYNGNTGCFDWIQFRFTADGNEMLTDNLCGCMDDPDHPSCDVGNYPYMNDPFVPSATEDLNETLVGTDIKFIIRTDGSSFGGKVSVQWQCMEPPNAVNTIEMAEALMMDNFPPSMAIDYGCTGRGEFDAFSTTIGTPVDDVDRAFFAWKKCVQCASGGDKSAVGAYDYDADNDSCGSENRAFCECDRTLINTLVALTPMASQTPASQCSGNGGHGGLACCNWNTHRWAAYNENNSCCGDDGVKEIGLC